MRSYFLSSTIAAMTSAQQISFVQRELSITFDGGEQKIYIADPRKRTEDFDEPPADENRFIYGPVSNDSNCNNGNGCEGADNTCHFTWPLFS